MVANNRITFFAQRKKPKMIAYKSDYNCKIGKIYSLDRKLGIGIKDEEFIFYKKIEDMECKMVQNKNIKIIEIQIIGDIITKLTNRPNRIEIKYITNKFKVLREVPKEEWKNCKFDKNNNLTYYKSSNGYWIKQEFDENNNNTYYENSNGHWSIQKFDKNNNEIYHEHSTGFWRKRKYDQNNNEIYYENSKGIWVLKEFDQENKEIYREDSTGIILRRKYDQIDSNIYTITTQYTKKKTGENINTTKTIKKSIAKIKST